LINVWESVAACKKNKVRGAILAIDMAKAFDTLSNDFLLEVYKFFGFGPSMIRWLQLIGHNRYACIKLGDNSLSRRFFLERGRPQGDVISPNTFNFCAQILIFKLELDKTVRSMQQTVPARINNNMHSFFMCESNRETSKNESLADDNTTLTMLDLASLRAAKEIIDTFGNISGLRCNFDKSIIMPVMDPTRAEAELINNLGFTMVEEFTLLGVKVNRNLDNTREIYLGIKLKIINLISFWERFRLSLPGRLTILKTCLISQINYIGCFLPPDPLVLEEIQAVCDTFVKKNIKIGTARMYLPPELGGLGCINLKTFLAAQNCSWIKRAHDMCIDNWRYDLKKFSPEGRIVDIIPSDLDSSVHPILHNFCLSLQLFNKNLCELNNNFWKANVIENPAIVAGPNNSNMLNREFFGNRMYNELSLVLRRKKFEDFFVGTRVKNLMEMREMGLPFNVATWFKFQASLNYNKIKLSRDPDPTRATTNISGILALKSKGSKKFSKVFDRARAQLNSVVDLRIINTFSILTGVVAPEEDDIKTALGLWRTPAFSNDCREFFFKLRHNQLMTNLRLNSFDSTVSKNCTFCRIRNTYNEETFSHLFFSCPSTWGLLQVVLFRMEPRPDPDLADFKKMYWYGATEDFSNDRRAILIIFELFRYTLWKFKQRRKLPNNNMFLDEFLFTLSVATSQSREIRFSIERCNLIANFLQARG
jgi:hypothetical protein